MQTAIAKHVVACDHCSASLGEHYATANNSIQVPLKVSSQDHNGDMRTEHKTHHFCSEACMASHLNERVLKQKQSQLAMASAVISGDILILNAAALKKEKPQ